jgi:hypothetical protein
MATKQAAKEEKVTVADIATKTVGEESTALATQPQAASPAATSHALSPKLAGGYDVEDVGTGFEDFTQDDLAIPFLAIMQKGSPYVDEDNPKYIPGCKAGMLMNTVTQKLYPGKDVGVRFIPVHRHRSYIEWIPKDDGGGLVNVFEPDAKEVREVLAKAGKKFGKLKIGDGNDLQETYNVYGLLVEDGDIGVPMVLSMASSQIGPYKKWMTQATSIKRPGADGNLSTPPMFSHVYRLKTEFFQKGDNTWYKWKVEFDGKDAAACNLPQDNPLFAEAKKLRGMIMSGAAKADLKSLVQEEEAEAAYEM